MGRHFTTMYCCEEPLPLRRNRATYRARAPGARWGRSNRSVTCHEEPFLGGAPSIGTCRRVSPVEDYQGSHYEVHGCATALFTSYRQPSLEKMWDVGN